MHVPPWNSTKKFRIPDPTAVRFQDRELQLFDGTRLMSAAKFEDLKAAEGLTEAQLEARGVRKIHPAFRKGSSPQSTYIYRVPQCMSPRQNWDSPQPLSRKNESCPVCLSF
jgi:hypothetical protein